MNTAEQAILFYHLFLLPTSPPPPPPNPPVASLSQEGLHETRHHRSGRVDLRRGRAAIFIGCTQIWHRDGHTSILNACGLFVFQDGEQGRSQTFAEGVDSYLAQGLKHNARPLRRKNKNQISEESEPHMK